MGGPRVHLASFPAIWLTPLRPLQVAFLQGLCGPCPFSMVCNGRWSMGVCDTMSYCTG